MRRVGQGFYVRSICAIGTAAIRRLKEVYVVGKMERGCWYPVTLIAAVYILPAPVVFAGPSNLVRVQPIVLQESSGLEVVTGDLPPGAPSVVVGAAFVIELWAQQVDPSLGGLQCVFSDLSHSATGMTCVDSTASSFFDVLDTGECEPPDLIDELGGCGFSVGIGIIPEWVLVATVEMHADAESSGNVVVSAGARTSISISSFGNVPVDQIEFGSSAPFDIVGTGTGACCYADTCSEGLDAPTCIASGGRYLGDGLTCDGDPDGDGVIGCDDVCPTTLAPGGVDASGRPLGDLNGDCDVDLEDFAILQMNLTGP